MLSELFSNLSALTQENEAQRKEISKCAEKIGQLNQKQQENELDRQALTQEKLAFRHEIAKIKDNKQVDVHKFNFLTVENKKLKEFVKKEGEQVLF